MVPRWCYRILSPDRRKWWHPLMRGINVPWHILFYLSHVNLDSWFHLNKDGSCLSVNWPHLLHNFVHRNPIISLLFLRSRLNYNLFFTKLILNNFGLIIYEILALLLVFIYTDSLLNLFFKFEIFLMSVLIKSVPSCEILPQLAQKVIGVYHFYEAFLRNALYGNNICSIE